VLPDVNSLVPQVSVLLHYFLLDYVLPVRQYEQVQKLLPAY
jgi:hypothetical protein